MALSYGTKQIRQKSWRVYIALANTANLSGNLAIALAGDMDDVDTCIADMEELGECRDDSISVVGEDGESIEGNVVGNFVINKNCSMTAELINTTPDNIAALEEFDGTAITVLLVESGVHAGYKTIVAIENVNVSYSENITGGDTIRSTISIAQSPKNIGKFRKIADVGVV